MMLSVGNLTGVSCSQTSHHERFQPSVRLQERLHSLVEAIEERWDCACEGFLMQMVERLTRSYAALTQRQTEELMSNTTKAAATTVGM